MVPVFLQFSQVSICQLHRFQPKIAQIMLFVMKWVLSQTQSRRFSGSTSNYYHSINQIGRYLINTFVISLLHLCDKSIPKQIPGIRLIAIIYQNKSLFNIVIYMEKSFENKKREKPLYKLNRQQAILERDYLWLKEYNQKCAFTIKTILLCIFALSIAIIIVTFTTKRYHYIMNGQANCITSLFDASNFFEPLCGICQHGWTLQNGVCVFN